MPSRTAPRAASAVESVAVWGWSPPLRSVVRPLAPAGELLSAGVYRDVSAAVVDLYTPISESELSAGTGIVIRPNGLVLTNTHVVRAGQRITAWDVGTARSYQGVLIDWDNDRDVAVVRLIGASGLPVARLGDSDTLEVGDLVEAIGNAGGHGGAPTVTTGSVTGLGRSAIVKDRDEGLSRPLRGLIAVSARVHPGDSGGSLVTPDGSVIGMDTAADTRTGYAITINEALTVARTLTREDRPNGDQSSRHGTGLSASPYGGIRVLAPSPPRLGPPDQLAGEHRRRSTSERNPGRARGVSAGAGLGVGAAGVHGRVGLRLGGAR